MQEADGQIDFKEYSILLGRYIVDPESLTNHCQKM